MKCRAYKRSSSIRALRAKYSKKMAPGPEAGYYEGTERDPLLGVPNASGKTDVEKVTNGIQKKPVRGPDGFLSWVVAIANFLINFIVVGLGRMSGILYVVFMHMFNADRKTASIPFIVQQAVRNLFGPLAGILGQKYGVRSVVIAGGFIGTISAAVCFFAMDLNWITVMWGLVFGYFRDTLGSYDKMFYVNGAICAGIGLIWIFEPYIVRLSRNEKLSDYEKLPEITQD